MYANLVLRCTLNRVITHPILQRRLVHSSLCQSGTRLAPIPQISNLLSRRDVFVKNPFINQVSKRNTTTIPQYNLPNSLPDLREPFVALNRIGKYTFGILVGAIITGLWSNFAYYQSKSLANDIDHLVKEDGNRDIVKLKKEEIRGLLIAGPNTIGVLESGVIDRLCEAFRPNNQDNREILEFLNGFAYLDRVLCMEIANKVDWDFLMTFPENLLEQILVARLLESCSLIDENRPMLAQIQNLDEFLLTLLASQEEELFGVGIHTIAALSRNYEARLSLLNIFPEVVLTSLEEADPELRNYAKEASKNITNHPLDDPEYEQLLKLCLSMIRQNLPHQDFKKWKEEQYVAEKWKLPFILKEAALASALSVPWSIFRWYRHFGAVRKTGHFSNMDFSWLMTYRLPTGMIGAATIVLFVDFLGKEKEERRYSSKNQSIAVAPVSVIATGLFGFFILGFAPYCLLPSVAAIVYMNSKADEWGDHRYYDYHNFVEPRTIVKRSF